MNNTTFELNLILNLINIYTHIHIYVHISNSKSSRFLLIFLISKILCREVHISSYSYVLCRRRSKIYLVHTQYLQLPGGLFTQTSIFNLIQRTNFENCCFVCIFAKKIIIVFFYKGNIAIREVKFSFVFID